MNCDWPKLCSKFTCLEPGSTPDGYGECFSATNGTNSASYEHNITNSYSINLASVDIPIIDTKRIFTASSNEQISAPTPTSVYMVDGGTFWCFSDGGATSHAYRMKEDCTIIKSTLHYLDLRYGICLYRKNTETMKFDVTTTQTNTFKNPWNTTQHGSIKLFGGNNQNWSNDCKEEWFLIKDGVQRLLTTCPYRPVPELTPFASGGSNALFDPAYTGIPNLELIVNMPPASSIDEVPWDDELRYHGFYNYRGSPEYDVNFVKPDGGCRDYFYPAWCRALQEDPIWKAVADSRYMLSWGGSQPINRNDYTPPPITVDPLPIGSFVKHPKVGEVWQFLISKRDSTSHLETSPNIDAIIKASLAKNGITPQQGTMLYYPIGVI